MKALPLQKRDSTEHRMQPNGARADDSGLKIPRENVFPVKTAPGAAKVPNV
jgi:hypothetical protein